MAQPTPMSDDEQKAMEHIYVNELGASSRGEMPLTAWKSVRVCPMQGPHACAFNLLHRRQRYCYSRTEVHGSRHYGSTMVDTARPIFVPASLLVRLELRGMTGSDKIFFSFPFSLSLSLSVSSSLLLLVGAAWIMIDRAPRSLPWPPLLLH